MSKDFFIFIVVLLRTSIFFSLFPIFGSKNFPTIFRIGFSLAFSLLLTSFVNVGEINMTIPTFVMTEIIWGIVLALMARFIFFAVDMAGQIVSNSMGLSIATIYNPEVGQSTEIARFYGILAIFVFLATDAHHQLIYLLVKSYETPMSIKNFGVLSENLIEISKSMFILALKIAAPVMVGMIVSNLIAGFLHKAVPQLNVFFVLFPVFAFIGFSIMILGIPVFIKTFLKSINTIEKNLENFFLIMRT